MLRRVVLRRVARVAPLRIAAGGQPSRKGGLNSVNLINPESSPVATTHVFDLYIAIAHIAGSTGSAQTSGTGPGTRTSRQHRPRPNKRHRAGRITARSPPRLLAAGWKRKHTTHRVMLNRATRLKKTRFKKHG